MATERLSSIHSHVHAHPLDYIDNLEYDEQRAIYDKAIKQWPVRGGSAQNIRVIGSGAFGNPSSGCIVCSMHPCVC